jgi:uncharacterized repeat protein (TIGR02543 family)
MDTDKSVTATFTQDAYTLTITPVGSGTVAKDPDAATYTYGTQVTLTPTPAAGWSFSAWSGACSGGGACVVTMDGNKVVTATFLANPVTLTINQPTGGSITATPTGPYHFGDVVTVEATANTGYHFSGWSGDLSGTDNPTTITLNGDKTISAGFERNAVTLTINQSTGGTITATPAGPYYYGDVVTVEAQTNSGYDFTGWTGDLSGTTNPTTITLNGNKTVGATFQQYVTLTINQPTGGTITPSPVGPYHLNDIVTLTATANPGYNFFYWTGDASGTTNPVMITMNGNKTVSAFVQSGTLRESFDTLTGWTAKGSGTMTLETVNFKEGLAAIRLTMPVRVVQGKIDLNITKAVNWNLSDTQGNLKFWLYVSNTGSPKGFQILLSNDSNFKDYFLANISLIPGWNLINLSTGNWIKFGTASWTRPFIREQYSSTGSGGAYFIVDGLTTGGGAQAGSSIYGNEMDIIITAQIPAGLQDISNR